MDIQFDIFQHLLKAPSKDFISRSILEAFIHRDNAHFSDNVIKSTSESLEIDAASAEQLLKSFSELIKKIIFESRTDLAQIQELFAQSSLQSNLVNLISKLLLEKTAMFRKNLIDNENMMPKLVDFDWRVDIKMASNLASTDSEQNKSGQQTCILQLQNDDEKIPENKTTASVLSSKSASSTLSTKTPAAATANYIAVRPVLDIYEIIRQQFAKRSERQLGLLSFFARPYPTDKCGSNGLPLTPKSIRVYGNFQSLRRLTHRALCRYVDMQRGNHERLFVISEHYTLTLHDLLHDTYIYQLIMAHGGLLLAWTRQLVDALVYLSDRQVVHRFLHLRHVCVTPSGNAKLSHYGLYHMSENGYCVQFPVAQLVTLAPECLLLEHRHGNKYAECPTNNGEQNGALRDAKADVWALGVLLFQFVFGLSSQTESSAQQLHELLAPARILDQALALLRRVAAKRRRTKRGAQHQDDSAQDDDDKTGDDDDDTGYEYMLGLYAIDDARRASVEQRVRPGVLRVMRACLVVVASERPTFRQLRSFMASEVDFRDVFTRQERQRQRMPAANSNHSDNDNESEASSQDSSDSEEHAEEDDCADSGSSGGALKLRLFEGRTRATHLTLPLSVHDRQDHAMAMLKKKTSRIKSGDDPEVKQQQETDHLWRRGVDEVYYLWRLAGGDCLQTLAQNGRLEARLFAVEKLPVYTSVRDGCEHGKPFDPEKLFDQTIVPLSLQQLRTRLAALRPDAFYPIKTADDRDESATTTTTTTTATTPTTTSKPLNGLSAAEDMLSEMHKQPLNIRESDIEYQFHRVILFARLLAGYPYTRRALLAACRVDIPPIYRALAWAALLDVPLDVSDAYARINKELVTSTDRQIDVDIPRCHQYDPLMASPQAHAKLKRVLKAWVIASPAHLVYWQGLDSLCAPFLHLHFNNEAAAYGCFVRFIDKYAARFFLRDNSAVIQEYLALFAQLVAYHDPELANHFERIEFRPDLYAIPWFLTMFAHIFPLHKIFHLWDTLLLGSSAYPLCIGVAILRQLRTLLLNSDFNECILLFSELPEININKCVSDSLEICAATPVSCMYRQYALSLPTSTPTTTAATTTTTTTTTGTNTTHLSNDAGDAAGLTDPYLDMDAISLEEMRSIVCARICIRDVLALTASDAGGMGRELVLVDVRSAGEFAQAFVTGSRNVPHDSVNMSRLMQLIGSADSTPAAQQTNGSESAAGDATGFLLHLMQQHRTHIKVVYGSQAKQTHAVELANTLVRLGCTRVAVLNRGFEAFKSTHIYQQQF